MAKIYVASSWRNKYQPEEYIKNLTHPVAEKQEPELMYKLFDGVVGTIDDLLAALL